MVTPEILSNDYEEDGIAKEIGKLHCPGTIKTLRYNDVQIT